MKYLDGEGDSYKVVHDLDVLLSEGVFTALDQELGY
jgi:hypothetical protein